MRLTKINRRAILITSFFGIVSLVAATQVSWSQTETEPRGVPNFGHVADNLYRGGQPTPDGLNALHEMGVGMVINFRDEPKEMADEKREVESLGIKYVGIPWSASHDPSSAQIVDFLDLVRASPNTKIFVHCRRGADRTGVMIASYRIAVEHEPVSNAVSEMRQYHYDWVWLPHLQRYIESLPGLLDKDPEFAAYRPQPTSTK
jgi:tyrosine-protein phosphatase SIW14